MNKALRGVKTRERDLFLEAPTRLPYATLGPFHPRAAVSGHFHPASNG